MSPSSPKQVETKSQAEALIPRFQLEKILNQDQNGRRISLQGTIDSRPALFVLERAAFPSDTNSINQLLTTIPNTTNLGANDIYRWYMATRSVPHPISNTPTSAASTESQATPHTTMETTPLTIIHDLKLNLIYPCTPQHIAKYTSQRVRMVCETPEIYTRYIRPYMSSQRNKGRLDWVFNILDGRAEQEDVILRCDWGLGSREPPGFLLLPDLNWDRKSVQGMHLLALVERRDIWSLRDLTKKHVPWLKSVRDRAVDAAATKVFPEGEIERDEIKCYVHYQPTYYHFHIHIVHASLEAGATQSVGKAFGLGNIISQLENMADPSPPSTQASTSSDEKAPMPKEPGMHQLDMHYYMGENSDLWKKCFEPLKRGGAVTLLD